MAQLELQPISVGKSKRKLHSSLRIDMTPMVDLGFLLITFFIFTTTMSTPKITSLFMPANGEPAKVKASHSLTFLLGDNDKVYAFGGSFEDAVREHSIIQSGYNVYEGVGKLIREKQEKLRTSDQEGKDALVMIIKPASKSSYKNFVDALDETLINDVKKYAVVDLTQEEKDFLKDK